MNNVYGTKRPANITSDDVDIFYSYRPSRASESTGGTSFTKLDSSCLIQTYAKGEDDTAMVLPGAFDLRLPLDKFSEKGIYNIYIKPKEIKTRIVDVSTLAIDSGVRGIVLSTEGLDDSCSVNGGLVGYRVEYFDEEDKRLDYFRIITSSNKCEPVLQQLTSTRQKSTRYVFNDSTNLIFCTVTPSVSASFNNDMPNIGTTTQKIALVSTKFNPVMMEVEMVDHDIETISTMLEGDQIRDLDNATITTYNGNKEVYHHAEYYTLKSKLGAPLYEVKTKKDNINSSDLKYENIVE